MKIVECVPNFSEGKDEVVVKKIVQAISSVEGVKILDSEMDANHNRSVITFISTPEAALEAAYRGIKEAAALIDMGKHKGEHPRFGASDVIPFIPVSGVSMDECIEISRKLGEKVGNELGIPVYMYGNSAMREYRKNLEDIRNKNFQLEELTENIQSDHWKPDFGPQKIGSAGASIIGSRDYLIAYNVNLNTNDLEIGKRIAKALRAKDGLRQRNKNINIRFLEFTNNQTVENFLLGLATISTIQLVIIPSELSLVYSITRRGKMTSTAEILKRIQRDLDLHAQILIRMYLTILNENPALTSQELKTSLVKLMRDITNMETDFTQFLSENMIPGLNNLVVAKFTQALTNKVLKEFSLEPLFPGVGGQPIPWFEGYSELKNR